jgi:diguanylate cyclase (GGDEF)-like protein
MRDPVAFAEFKSQMWAQRLRYIRISILIAAALFFCLWGRDWVMDPKHAILALPYRVGASGFYLALYAALALSPRLRRHPAYVYVIGILAAPVLLLAVSLPLHGGNFTFFGGIIIIVMAVAIIGPYARFAILLMLGVVCIANLMLFLLIELGVSAPGMPAPQEAFGMGVMHLEAFAFGSILSTIDTARAWSLNAQSRELQEQAETDPLTGAENRRRLQRDFKDEMARQQRSGETMALLVLDLDHFKKVNDTFGHGVGDEVLRAVADRWREALREIDSLARIGGEEFVALLPETDAGGAQKAGDRLCRVTAREPFQTSVGDIRQSVSIGCTLVGAADRDLDKMIKKADMALYEAKSRGRNRCILA